MIKEKEFWENKGAEMYLKGTYDESSISDYQFNLIKKLSLPNKNVLEIGPGTGRDIKRFKEEKFNLNALDISKPFIKKLNNEFDGKFIVGDMRKDLNKFSDIGLIYSRWSIIFLTYNEFKKFLKRAKNILSEGGKLLVSLREGNSLHNIHKTTKMQSLQMNVNNLVKATPEEMRIDFVEVINQETKQEKNDRQITFVITKDTKKDNRNIYI